MTIPTKHYLQFYQLRELRNNGGDDTVIPQLAELLFCYPELPLNYLPPQLVETFINDDTESLKNLLKQVPFWKRTKFKIPDSLEIKDKYKNLYLSLMSISVILGKKNMINLLVDLGCDIDF